MIKDNIFFPTFDEYLRLPYLSFSIDGPSGISATTIREIFDVECNSLWNKLDFEFVDNLGLSVLRHQIQKDFFEEIRQILSKNYSEFKLPQNQAILQPSILCIKNILSNLDINFLEIDVPIFDFGIHNNSEKTIVNYKLLNQEILHSQNQGKFSILYLESDYKIDFNKINLENLNNILFISSISKLYGIKSIPVAWCFIPNFDIYKIILEYILKNENSISYQSQILALSAIRNSEFILSANETIREINNNLLKVFFHRNNKFFKWIPPTRGFLSQLKIIDSNISPVEYQKILLDNAKIKINLSSDKKYLIICTGQANLSKALSAWQEFIEKNPNLHNHS